MSQPNSTEILVRECVKHALAMPIPEGQRFLQTLLTAVGDEPAVESLRHAYIHLHTATEQLELIAAGQRDLL
jgi:hypothetical protein